MKKIFIFLFCLCAGLVSGQGQSKRVLFLGNSYTYVNNLPLMLSDIALSMGDTVITDNNTPGGYTLELHSTNTTSLNKIMTGNWDYVVLQEQSQLPSFPISQVETEVFPYAKMLDSIINFYNPCAETILYMTWGRKNGDASNCASWPPVCTYQGMDSLLSLRYRMMADSNNAIVSPVGAVWKDIRQNFPGIELYQADESHPSVSGTYAAACSFYTSIFRKDPVLITFNSSLAFAEASAIRDATKIVVYDSLLKWNIGKYDPLADFSYSVSGPNEITFSNNSQYADINNWNFGDGNTSTTLNPVHMYSSAGTYTVSLVAERCGASDTLTMSVNVTASGMQEGDGIDFTVYPNPVGFSLNVIHKYPDQYAYVIFNLSGEQVLKGNSTNRLETIDVSLLSDGFYFLELLFENGSVARQKFVKATE